MNLLNTFKKYFDKKTDPEKTILPFTSANQVLDIDTKYYVDERINALQRYCDTLANFVTPQVFNIESTDDVSFASNLFNIVVIGKQVILVGALYTKATGAGITAGYHYYDLPIKLKPISNQAINETMIRFSGDQHRIQYGVSQSEPAKFTFYTRDDIPTGQTIPITLSYVLSDAIDWSEA